MGIDPGTGRLGFGIIEYTKVATKFIDGGVITTDPHTPLADRLLTIHDDLEELLSFHKPEVLAVEKLFFTKNITTAISVSHARGVVLLLGKKQNCKLYEYTPNEIKQAVTGYGGADKSQIQEMVRVQLKLKSIPQPDDAADALAVALCCAQGIDNPAHSPSNTV